MSAVQPGSLVLVSGINGHVASCITLRLLQHGCQVRGTVRAVRSASFVKNALSEYGDKLEVFEVPDIIQPGAFDDALRGSKIEAEKAAWTFMSHDESSFSLTTILGSITLGPILKSVAGPCHQDVSLGQLYDTFADPPRVSGVSPVVSSIGSHAFDLADLFLASLTSEKVLGHRDPEKADAPCMNYPGAGVIKFDTSLEKELLGGKWRSLEDAVLTCARDILEKEKKGWEKL